MTYQQYFSATLLIVLVTFVAGCGGGVLKTNRVEGIVTHQGAPLAEASVTFYPAGSGTTPAFGKTDASGKYCLQTLAGAVDAGTTPGEYTVTISKRKAVPTGRKISKGDGTDELEDELTMQETLPAKYTTVQSTPFKAIVENKQVNTFDFTLE